MTRRSVLIVRLALGASACILVSAFTGCANYHLGTTGRLGFSTLYVAPVQNRTLLPQAPAILSTALREKLLRDGRVTLVNSPAAAEATLEVIVKDYHRELLAARTDDTGLARKFSLVLDTTCTLRDNRTGQPLFADRPVQVRRDSFTDGGQLQSEYQALPLLAQSLAEKVSHAVLDVW